MALKKHGGPRPGSGRKPVKDKKEAIFIYVRSSTIKRHGGKDKAKRFAESALENVDN